MAWIVKYFWNVLFLTCILFGVTSSVTSSDKYLIEAKVFMDKAAYDIYHRISRKNKNGLRTEMNAFFVDVSDLLGSLKEYSINVDIRIKELIILTKNILPADSWNDKIKPEKAVGSFYKWITSKTNSKYQGYDLALLFTGYRFYNNKIGYSYVVSVCQPYANGVIAYRGTYRDVLTTAHEIGHMIGGHHDGGRKAPHCHASSGYIMKAIVGSASLNQFHFSNCSAKSINATLDKLTKNGTNCLTNGVVASGHKGPRFGAILSPDQFCQRQYKYNKAWANTVSIAALGENICIQLPCEVRVSGNMNYNSFIDTPQGMKCAKGKECVQGKCVPKQNGN